MSRGSCSCRCLCTRSLFGLVFLYSCSVFLCGVRCLCRCLVIELVTVCVTSFVDVLFLWVFCSVVFSLCRCLCTSTCLVFVVCVLVLVGFLFV